MTNITTILFDLDGTIADTNEVIIRSIIDTLDRETGRPWMREELMPCWGRQLRKQLRFLHPEINLERAVPFYRRRYAGYHDTLLREFPGMRAVLEALQSGGYRLGVVTSKKHAGAHQTLQAIGYAPFFPLVIVEEDTQRHKPAPDPLLLALERLQVVPESAIYIGDNPDDIIAAHAAGMRAVAVAWSLRHRDELVAAQPDAIIDTPEELLSFCRHSL